MNFVSRLVQSPSISTKTRRRTGIWLFGVILVAVGLGVAVFVWVLNPTVRHIHKFTAEIAQARTALQQGVSPDSMSQAQRHLMRSKSELDALRPLVLPALRIGRLGSNIPGVSTRVKQISALWVFGNAAVDFANETLTVAIDSQTAFETAGIGGLADVVPQLQPQFEQLGQTYITAQSARQTLANVDWLPAQQASQLQDALAQWDEYTPYFDLIFADDSPIVATAVSPDLWANMLALKQSVADITAIADTQNADYARLAQLPKQLTIMRTEFEALQTQIDPIITFLQTSDAAHTLGIPTEQVIAWEAFLDELTAAGQETSDALMLVVTNMEESGTSGAVSVIPEVYRHIRQAHDDIDRATDLRGKIHPIENVPDTIANPLNQILVMWDNLSPDLTAAFKTSNNVFQVLPQLLGYDKPVRFLLLIQSSDELRATGGFIGGIGTIRIEQGKITAATLREVTELDNVPEVNGQYLTRWTQPPAPLVNYMGLGHWYLRDANWWADFPATARQAADFWAINHTEPVDGVIAITENGVINLLQALGTLKTIDGETVNAENLKNFAALHIYQGDQPAGVEQSSLINELSLALINETGKVSLGRAVKLAHYFQTAAVRHDILIASFDPPTAAGLFKLGIYGALKGQNDDYFYLVESNVSYNKLSPFIEQDLRYEVQLKPDATPQEASLIVDERNVYVPGAGVRGYPQGYYDGGRWNPQTRRVEQRPTYYGGYTRLYPTPSSKLIAAIGFDEGPDLFQENHRAVVGGYVGITAGERRQLQFKWEPNIQPSHPGEYRLLVQRQPGAPEHALTVIVKPPAGYEAYDISPEPISVTEDTITWHTVLDTDQSFVLKLKATAAVSPVLSSALPDVPSAPPITATRVATAPHQIAPAPPAPPGRTPLPMWITIPAIQVNAPIISVGLEASGIMASPDDAGIVGWYELGPRPGEASNAILAGHVDWKGEIGVFSRLSDLKIGDVIEIQSAPDVTFRFVVESMETYPTTNAPLADIFGASSKSVITLITCGGPYDSIRQEYKDRLIVRARKVVP